MNSYVETLAIQVSTNPVKHPKGMDGDTSAHEIYEIYESSKITQFIQVEPGKPGAEVSKKKNYKSKKEFAYRMCTG